MQMKVMAFSARPDERAFFEHWSQTLDIALTYQPEGLSMKNVNMTKGFDGVSCVGTCNLSAPVLEALAENGVRYVALRTIGFDMSICKLPPVWVSVCRTRGTRRIR